MITTCFKTKILSLPDGAYNLYYHDKRYGCTKSSHLDNKLIKFYAKELGGNDFISLNYYIDLKDGLKPCEMPQKKVIDFILEVTLIKD